MLKKCLIVIAIVLCSTGLMAQEIQARFTVIAAKVSTQVDKKVFQTLQTGLTNFLNTRRWTADAFQPSEKIDAIPATI